MSKQTTVTSTNNQMSVRTDRSRIFLGGTYRTEKGNFTNSTYDPIDFVPGEVLGRVSATGLLKKFTAAANDGSQYPIGIVTDPVTVDDGDTGEITYLVSGDVVGEKVILQDADTLDSTVANAGGRRVRDLIGAETVGVKLVNGTTEMTRVDPND